MFRVEWRPLRIAHILANLGLEVCAKEPLVTVARASRGTALDAFCQGEDILVIVGAEFDRSWSVEVRDLLGEEFPARINRTHGGGLRLRDLNEEVDVFVYREGRLEASWSLVHHGPGLHRVPIPRTASLPGAALPKWSQDDVLRMRELFEALAVSWPPDWLEKDAHLSHGFMRAAVLGRLGAPRSLTVAETRRLASGEFHDHFPDYWVQMDVLHNHLRHERDWAWAARHAIPPSGPAY